MGYEEELIRKIVCSVAMSLDGYIAGPNGEADWIVMDPEIDFSGMMARFDTILMGRKTFGVTQVMGGGQSTPGVTTYVVSRTLRKEDYPHLTIIAGDIGDAVSQLRASSGKDIWLFGGGHLFGSLLDLGLVDLVEVAVIPVLLGEGIPLLPECSQQTSLRLESSHVYKATGTVLLEYAVHQELV